MGRVDDPVKLRVGGLPDLAHPALAEEGGDVVVAEAGAGFERHGLVVVDVATLARKIHEESDLGRNTNAPAVVQSY